MQRIELKTPGEIRIMLEGGKKLAGIKSALFEEVKPGRTAYDLEVLANKLIAKEGAEASFKMVPGYHWATCVNVNSGLVHGIPSREVVFKRGDVVSLDLGIYFKGFHTDASFSKGLGADGETESFLAIGRKALAAAIIFCRSGNHIYDISRVIEETVTKAGYAPIRALTGHGVGRNLHEKPAVPCFVSGRKEESLILAEGLVLAIEVMYAMGKNDVILGKNGWTISMTDGKIAALFEETVAITSHGPLVLTA